MNVTWPMLWPAHLCPTSASMAAARSSSDAAAAQHRPQVGLADGEQAVAELALGGEPHPVAVPQKAGDAGDHADLAAAVGVAVPLGGR